MRMSPRLPTGSPGVVMFGSPQSPLPEPPPPREVCDLARSRGPSLDVRPARLIGSSRSSSGSVVCRKSYVLRSPQPPVTGGQAAEEDSAHEEAVLTREQGVHD